MRRTGCLLTLILAMVGSASQPARASVTVLGATVYPGASGSVSYPSATATQLANCPLYDGPNPLSLYDGGGASKGQVQLATGSTWTLATALSCGLGLHPGSVDSVVVDSPHIGFEDPLIRAARTDPAQYQDPGTGPALPVISNDGGEDLNAYVRPWRGGSDGNAGDWIPYGQGPISVVVYENGSRPLTVSATATRESVGGDSTRVTFSASVTDPTGAALQPSALMWSWNYDDGTALSTEPAPVHSFGAGRYAVTVQVTDAHTGAGGTATVLLDTGGAGGSGSAPQSGSGAGPSAAGPATGAQQSGTSEPAPGATAAPGATVAPASSSGPASQPSTLTPGAQRAAAGRAASRPSRVTPSGAPPAVRAQPSKPTSKAVTTSTPSPPAAAPPPVVAAQAPGVPKPTGPPLRRPHPATRHGGSGTVSSSRLVSGLLISDVSPVTAAHSPLVRTILGQPSDPVSVRRAVSPSPWPLVVGLGTVLLLLGCGALRELPGRLGDRRLPATL